jgi:hypothetical protein
MKKNENENEKQKQKREMEGCRMEEGMWGGM